MGDRGDPPETISVMVQSTGFLATSCSPLCYNSYLAVNVLTGSNGTYAKAQIIAYNVPRGTGA
jgi:hypothetical protein